MLHSLTIAAYNWLQVYHGQASCGNFKYAELKDRKL